MATRKAFRTQTSTTGTIEDTSHRNGELLIGPSAHFAPQGGSRLGGVPLRSVLEGCRRRRHSQNLSGLDAQDRTGQRNSSRLVCLLSGISPVRIHWPAQERSGDETQGEWRPEPPVRKGWMHNIPFSYRKGDRQGHACDYH